MPESRDVAVHIICDDIPLAEYDIQEDVDNKTVTCWIASEVGKAFQVRFRNALEGDDPTDRASFAVFMDDSEAEVRSVAVRSNSSNTIEGAIVSEGTLRTFQFASLETTDEESAAAAKSSWEQLGSIKVRVCRVRTLGPAKTNAPIHDMTGAFKAAPVHELSKKAGTHRISLGNTIPYTRSRVEVTWIDEKTSPYATFLFRYRPREILQAQGIIPLSTPASNQLCTSDPSTSGHGANGTASEIALPTPDKGKKRAQNATTHPNSTSGKRQRTSVNEVPVKLERLLDGEDVKPTVDDLDNDASSDAELSVIKQQLEISMEQMQTLKKQMEKIEARKRSKATKGVVKKRASSAALGEQSIIDLT